MSSGSIVIRGAREHNLKNVSLELPRNQLIVFTGLSGSGKSSLAFDTIYAEGQRRYVESLSAYARQFLGQMEKPDVDFIEGLSPAISIDQKTASRNPRSTVGTVTEIHDYLRLLFARAGVPHCPRVRTGGVPPDPAADRRPHPGAARGHPLPGDGPGGAGPQGGVRGPAEGAQPGGLQPGPHRRRGARAHRGHPPRPLLPAHHRGHRGPPGAARGHRAAAHRLPGDGPAPGRGGGAGRRGRRARRSRSASTSPATSAGCRSTICSPATSRSTAPTGPARPARGSGPASRWTGTRPSPTRSAHWPTAPSSRGRGASGPATTTGSSRGWPGSTGSKWTPRSASSRRNSRPSSWRAPGKSRSPSTTPTASGGPAATRRPTRAWSPS